MTPRREPRFRFVRLGCVAAIARAVEEEDAAFAATPWSAVALAAATPLRWGGVRIRGRLIHSASVDLPVAPAAAFAPIRRIGGAKGWYYGDWMWRLRGLVDQLSGGVGMRPRPARCGASCRRRGFGLLEGRGLRTGRPPAPQGGNEAAGPWLAGVRRHAARGRGFQGAPDRRLRRGRPVGTILLARPVSDSRPAVRGASSEHRQTRGPGDVLTLKNRPRARKAAMSRQFEAKINSHGDTKTQRKTGNSRKSGNHKGCPYQLRYGHGG